MEHALIPLKQDGTRYTFNTFPGSLVFNTVYGKDERLLIKLRFYLGDMHIIIRITSLRTCSCKDGCCVLT